MDSQTWARLEAVFFAALDVPPAERSAYLDGACGGDDRLRAEVAAMLLAHDAPADSGLEIERTLLNEGTHPGVRDTTAREGMAVGPWRLERLLGTGGMGEVWLACRAGGDFEQRAAVKLVRPGWRAAELVARFRHERRLLARLAHPNIATLLDGGMTEAGVPYLAMEYVDGRPITEWCAEEAPPLPRRLALFREVCEAVRFAHANLVVHRDLKPANILVTREGRPILLDFGIAKLLDDADGEASATRPEERLLTPEHAAPEQLRGDPATVATDVWALGALLFEMLAGRRPFDVQGRAPSSIERLVTAADPPLPSEVAPPGAARALRGDLDAIVLTAMRRDPAERYGSVERLQEDVDLHLAGLPVRARTGGWSYRAAKFARRNACPVAALSAFVLLLAASAGAWWHQARLVARERDRAVAARRDAEQAIAMLVEFFQVANPREVPGGDTLRVADMLDLMSGELAGSTESPRVRAKLWSALAEIHTAWSRFAEAESAAVRGIAAAREGGLRDEELQLAHQRARVILYRDGPDAAEPAMLESLERHEALYGPAAAELVPVLQDVATVTTDRTDAGAILARALAIAGKSPEHPGKLAALYNAVGSKDWGAGRYADALASFRRSHELLAARAEPGSVDLLSVQSNIAVCLVVLGRLDEAERLQREILDGRRRIFGEASLPVGASLHHLGVVLAKQCRNEEAVEALRESVRVLTAVVGPEHGDTILARRSLGSALVRAGRAEDGLAEMDAALAAYHARDDESPVEDVRVRLGRCELELYDGRPVSLELVRGLVSRARDLDHPGALRDATRVLGLAALAAPGEARPGEAEAALREALPYVEMSGIPDDADAHFLRLALALAQHDAGLPVDPAVLRASLAGCNPCGLASPFVLERARAVLER